MATAIQDPAELAELLGLLDQQGLYVPDDITTVEELVRYLLTSLKTASSTKKVLAARRAASGRNPDSPDAGDNGGDVSAKDAARILGQFSTAGDHRPRPRRRLSDADVAKAMVDRQEAFQKNPNFVRPAY